MPLSAPDRIARDAARPRIVALWEAMAGLRSTVSFMQSGAHPDDETSSMLAALWLRDGIALSYACSTRGEGGQNDIGTEATEALGVLRTSEMERSAERLNMRLYWLSQTPQDSVFDFGFSKLGTETMQKWGRARTLARFVDILRAEKPDILCPTFLDVPGQHGHHRAMTEAAHLVMGLAADPDFDGSSLPPWQVSKLYLPAFSGAGQAYDDDLPPPPETLRIAATGADPVSGFPYARIGQQSRASHATQAMGHWVPPGQERDWPLHLAQSHVPGPDTDLSAGLPATLADLDSADAGTAQSHIDACFAAFPDRSIILREASAAVSCLTRASVQPEHAHRIIRKVTQLSQVIRIAAGVEARGWLDRDWLRQSDEAQLTLETSQGDADALAASLNLPEGWSEYAGSVRLSQACPSDPYPDAYDPDLPRAPAMSVTLETYGVTSHSQIPLEVPPVVLPDRAATLMPGADIVNLAAERRDIALSLSDIAPHGATPSLTLPDGWSSAPSQDGLILHLPKDAEPGLYSLPLSLDGTLAQTVRRITHPHIENRALITPAEIQVRVLDVALPNARIGYIGADRDRVDHWLDRMGCTVHSVTDADLTSTTALQQFDTLVIGIFALRFRAGLADALPNIRRWVEAGGTLVTLYHRPWDNWDPTALPAPIEIGQPSLRWRVTDESAAVTILSDHPALSSPNQISATDWDGWHKERGLYFAKSWDPIFTPLLSMADPGEDAHRGALLSAEIGKGRHIHCALILHHQMEKLVPGAFRLMANLCAPRS